MQLLLHQFDQILVYFNYNGLGLGWGWGWCGFVASLYTTHLHFKLPCSGGRKCALIPRKYSSCLFWVNLLK